jgi:protoporphyrinogen/coproporphyrinogen III oxidase
VRGERLEFRMDDVDVVVVGGGISGLSAARALILSGCRVRLLERSHRCGGVVRTDRTAGFVVDAGPDTLLGHKPGAIALCRDIGLADSLTRPLLPTTTYVVRRGTACALPETSVLGFPTGLRSLVTTRAISWRGKARMALEPLVRPGASADESIAAFVHRRFGREAVTYLAEPMLAGLHKGDAATLSMQALFPSLLDGERRLGSVVRAWRAQPARQPGGGMLSLENGLQTLVDALRDGLPQDVVHTSVTVCGVERRAPTGLVVRLADGSGLRTRAVVLAVPPPAAARLTVGVHPPLSHLCDAIRTTSGSTVALAYRASAVPRLPRGWGMVVPALEGLQTSAISFVSSKWPGRTPAGHVLLRASLGGATRSDVLTSDDDGLANVAHTDINRLLGLRERPVQAWVYRWPDTFPQLEVGHLDRMATIDRALGDVPGLYLTASGFRGVGLSDCVTDAQRVACEVIHALGCRAPMVTAAR